MLGNPDAVWRRCHCYGEHYGATPVHRSERRVSAGSDCRLRLRNSKTGNAIIARDLPANDEASFAAVAQAARRSGSLVLAQLCHPGNQAIPPAFSIRICVSPIAADAKESASAVPAPAPFTVPDIEDIKFAFVHAATVLYEAGFDGVEVSPYASETRSVIAPCSVRTLVHAILLRGDEQAHFENRCRFMVEVICGIREAISDLGFIISAKLNRNSLDFIKLESGWGPETARHISQQLESLHVDVLELSGAMYEFSLRDAAGA